MKRGAWILMAVGLVVVADVGSSVMGKIVRVAVKEGDSVKTCQILAQLDPVQARSGPAAAPAQVQALEAEEQAARQQVQAALRGAIGQPAAVAVEALASPATRKSSPGRRATCSPFRSRRSCSARRPTAIARVSLS